MNSLRDPSVKYVVSAPENESVNLGDILSTSGRIEISGGKAVAGGRVDVSGTEGGSVVVAGTGTKGQAQVCSKPGFRKCYRVSGADARKRQNCSDYSNGRRFPD